MSTYDLQKIHNECGWHEEKIKSSKRCGCFYCKGKFAPSEITRWQNELPTSPKGAGKTALCPKCGIDAVLPESADHEITDELLEAMHVKWFLG